MKLALQCSPVLTGIKISNLLIIHKLEVNDVIKKFRDTLINVYILYTIGQKAILLIYREEQLEIYLKSEKVKELMYRLGYRYKNIDDVLIQFAKRYRNCRSSREKFPHEMGLILGYPVDDVQGFIENRGMNFLYVGYWKVYGNLLEAIETFQKYDFVKEIAIRTVKSKKDILQLLDLYYTSSLNRYEI